MRLVLVLSLGLSGRLAEPTSECQPAQGPAEAWMHSSAPPRDVIYHTVYAACNAVQRSGTVQLLFCILCRAVCGLEL